MNKYDSLYTGAHNDGYEPRITTVESFSTTSNNRLTILESFFTTADNRITALENFSTTANNRITTLETIHTGDLVINGHHIVIQDATIDPTTAPSATNWGGNGVKILDVNSNTFGYFQGMQTEENRLGVQVGVSRVIADETVYNNIKLWIEDDGTQKMSSMVPMNLIPGTSSESVSFTTNITSAASSWKDFLVNWIAPNHGWLQVYLNGSNTPAAQITDNNSGLQFRENGNGSRDYCITIPVAKGHSYTGSCVYSKTSSATFYPAATTF